MRRFDSHIDVEILRRYYHGEMSSVERNILEKRALDDPFLREAMEGFDENPGSFDAYYNAYSDRLKKPRSYTVLTALGILILLFIVSYSIQFNAPEKEENQIATNNDSLKTSLDPNTEDREADQEVEVLRPEIESMDEIKKEERISSEELKEKNKAIHAEIDAKQDMDTAKADVIQDIHIEENGYDPEYNMVVENWSRQGQEVMPTVYLYNLMVVDYRGMNRENDQITYKRYDLSGTSANMENDSIFARNALSETNVEIPYYIYLSKSMDFFSANRFKKALNRYQIILEQYPEDQNAYFYGALCYFNLGSYDKCDAYLQKVAQVTNSPFREDALWYRAKCALKKKNTAKAIELLEEIITQDGFYTEDAMQLIKQLTD